MQVVVRNIQKLFLAEPVWVLENLEHAFLILYDLHVRNHTVKGHKAVQGEPKPLSDCPGQVEIQFGQVNLWYNLSVGQAHF